MAPSHINIHRLQESQYMLQSILVYKPQDKAVVVVVDIQCIHKWNQDKVISYTGSCRTGVYQDKVISYTASCRTGVYQDKVISYTGSCSRTTLLLVGQGQGYKLHWFL